MAALTPAQRRVMVLRAKGLTYDEIGARLNTAEGTVRNHAKDAYRKLGAQNITEAFIALGWLRAPEA